VGLQQQALDALGKPGDVEIDQEPTGGLLKTKVGQELGQVNREELALREIQYRSRVPLTLRYKGAKVGNGYVIDLIIEERLIVEIKSVSELTAEAGVIARLEQPRSQMPVNLDGRPDHPVAEVIGGMVDEGHASSGQSKMDCSGRIAATSRRGHNHRHAPLQSFSVSSVPPW
jgi:hypothetical protein